MTTPDSTYEWRRKGEHVTELLMKLTLLTCAALAGLAAPAVAAPAYTLSKSLALGAPDRWDYVVVDDATARVYVAHADHLDVIDGRTGTIVGKVEGIPGGTHGTVISTVTHQGFTDDGRAGKAVVFDLKTLKVTHQIAADADADAIALDPVTGRVFIIEGDPAAITVIDPKSDAVVATIKVGEKLEYGAADGHGAVFVAGEEKGDVVKVDTRKNTVAAHWPTSGCLSPHGLALDPIAHRVFMGCANSVMMVVDSVSGRTVAKLPIGRGNDAVAFDPVRRRVFSSNGADGTLSVYQESSPDHYTALEAIQTAVSARTMAVDSKTGRVFVAAAGTDPSPTAGGRPHVRPGTLKLMMFDPR